MADLDLESALSSLLAIDKAFVTRPLAVLIGGPLPVPLMPPEIDFPEEFQVPTVAYSRGDAQVETKLQRLTGISDRLLPLPMSSAEDVVIDQNSYHAKKLFNVRPAARAIASGELLEANGSAKRFVAVSYTDASEFWISIQASLTDPEGETLAFVVEADGAAAAGSYDESGFKSDTVDGCLVRVSPLGGRGTAIGESKFGSISSISAERSADVISLTILGEFEIDDSRRFATCEIDISDDVMSLSVYVMGKEGPLLTASTPRERTNLRLIGGMQSPRDGRIVILDRESGGEIREIPIQGRLAGSTWDGEYLWQALWPEGKVAKIDIKDPGSIVDTISLPGETMINGVAIKDNMIVAGVCSQNIMPQHGDTALDFFDLSNTNLVRRIPRPHVSSSGFCWSPIGILSVVSGLDQTPVSSDSAIAVLDEDRGAITETIILPRNLRVEDICYEDEGIILVVVTKGVAGINQPSEIYSLVREAQD